MMWNFMKLVVPRIPIGVPATIRASFAFYNTVEECDALVAGLRKCVEVFRG